MEFNEPNLYRGRDYVLNEHIIIHHPTLGQIFDYGEREYWNFVTLVCATPSDLKHFLFDNYQLYFDEVDEFNAFCLFAGAFDRERSKIIFGNLNFQSLKLRIDPKNGLPTIFDDNGLIINKAIYTIMTDYIRKMNGLTKNIERAGNEHTRKVMIDLSRSDALLNQNKPYNSPLLPIISTLVNSPGFKYNYDTVWGMPIYAFLDSMKRIAHIEHVKGLTGGIYAGTISAKEIDKKELNMFSEI